MSDDVDPLTDELERIAGQVSPTARRLLAREVAAELRSEHVRRIRANVTPEGDAMHPRTPGEGKDRRRGRMFRRATGKLRMLATPALAQLAFVGRSSRVLAVHHFGLRDRVSREANAPEVRYPERPLLGLTPEDRLRILDKAATHIAGG